MKKRKLNNGYGLPLLFVVMYIITFVVIIVVMGFGWDPSPASKEQPPSEEVVAMVQIEEYCPVVILPNRG